MRRSISTPPGVQLARALAVALCCGCNAGASAPASHPKDAPLVVAPKALDSVEVEATAMERLLPLVGTLVADERAVMSFQVAGRVQSVQVDLGSSVKRGQVLAVLDAREMELRVDQAEALLAQARARAGLLEGGDARRLDVESLSEVRQARALLEQAEQNRVRVAALFAQGQVAAAVMEAADAGLTVARGRLQAALEGAAERVAVLQQRQAEVDLARRQLAECRLVAPFDGAIEARTVSPGQTLSAGAPVLTVVRMDPLRARLDVPEQHAGAVQLQQGVRLTVDGQPGEHTGVITRLGPVIHAQTRVMTVEAEVRNNGTLRPGNLVRATLVTDPDEPALSVPEGAITTFAGVEKVVVLTDGKTKDRMVTTGRREGGRVEVLSGLKAGERVVLPAGSGPRSPPAGK